jgi:Tol biopolymer transport system component
MSKRLLLATMIAIAVFLAFPLEAVGTFPGRSGRIAFDLNGSIYTVEPNGSGLTLIAARPPSRISAFFAAEWAPDGNTLALVNDEIRRNGTSSLTVTDAEGRNLRPIALPSFHVDDVSWHPDAKEFALAGAPQGQRALEGSLYRVSVSGGTPTLFTGSLRGDLYDPEWAPDGQTLLFSRAADLGGDPSLYAASGDGSRVHRLTVGRFERTDEDADWSPDGRRIVFARSSITGPGIYVMHADGTRKRRLTATDDFAPVWSPDGRKIAFVRPGAGALGSIRPKGIYLMRADGSRVRRIVAWKHRRTRIVRDLDWQPVRASR